MPAKKRQAESLRRLQLKMPPALLDAARELAAARGETVNRLVRRLLASAVGDPSLDCTRPRGRPHTDKAA